MSTDVWRPSHLYDSFYKAYLRLYPSFATQMGDNDYDYLFDGWYTAAHRAAVREFVREQRNAIKRTVCTKPKDQVYLQTLSMVVDNEERMAMSNMHLLAVNHFDQNPFRNLLDLVDTGKQTLISRQQLYNWIARVEGFLATLPELRENLREGIRKKIVLPKAVVDLLIKDLRNFSLRSVPRKNVSISLRQEFQHFMERFFVTQARKFADFLQADYLPYAKDSLGLYGIPGAQDMYRANRLSQVSNAPEPEDVFQLGLRLVKDISNKQAAIRKNLNFEGDHLKFVEEILKSKSNFFKNEKALIDAYRQKVNQLKRQIKLQITVPSRVKTVPVVRVPKEQAAFQSQAYYLPGDMTNSDPGTFFINTRDWQDSMKSDVTNLALHEAMPGHGLHSQLVNLNPDIPRIFKLLQFNDTIEGWGLYCETWDVPDYKDPITSYSTLNAAQIRAVRLVIDVAIHAKGWSYDKCFQFMREYLCDTDQSIRAEIMRYSSIPFQAATYMIGCRWIHKLKDRWLKKHPRKTAKHFHDVFMDHSELPLAAIEKLLT